ncbi:sodium:proton exchanger [Sphingopyxis sp. H038]|jgi:monovalent cation:proton antiporter-2 (CPA2) family protein|uniref:cation:proton antiporter domain-containing protein n=1 Tax=unclassified Sphingopyxis TaxID=2614943 RepID=UPI000731D4FD|nr:MULTISPECIES: cation:proton antiporter [unclassified Sphingopyxis]KTE01667.1 sodium:proton exchanger [Sphingopyxis sp. H012]KTE11915.1 sodium:proton exchanger [Sphingopyxis sp. H053]KTE16180.1 sodium:proton exchanger [Sphingopyxis sp. H093]KTE29654.1 sodium:proton exchanger [Sphingopyxis sp. H080]KTE34496.1 sodium:proton exchanger [Sphingopyxis sp. H038]
MTLLALTAAASEAAGKVAETATDTALVEGAILLGVATLFVLIFRRLGLGAVLGYLIAGAIVGPHGLGLVGGGESKLAFAELGIAFLLFLVGLELSPRRLWDMRRAIFGLGLAQVVVTGLVLTGLIHLTLGFSPAASLALGLPLALSSTAQVLPGLKSSGRINSPFGEKAFSILLFQDLALVPMITIVAVLSRAPADPSAPPGWQMAFFTLWAIVVLVLAGRFVVNPLLRIIGRYGERELFVVVGLLTILASAALMHSLHLSTALGAFIAGVMLADSPYRHEIESDVEPFRLILLGLFFLAVGMVLDVGAVIERPLLVLSLALGLVAVKVIVLTLIVKLFGKPWPVALGLGLLLSQGGEFGFLLFAQAADALLIDPAAASLFSAVVTLSMVTTPFLMLFARNLEFSPAAEPADLDDPAGAPRGSAIVVGYGRFGQIVSQMLHGVACSVTLIDKKPSQIELSSRFDTKVYFGDGLRVDLLRRAGADEARLIIFCIDDASVDAAALKPIVDAFPNAKVLMRVFDRRQLLAVEGAGVDGVIREVFESSVAMGLTALRYLDVDPREMEDVEATLRHLDETRLQAQIDEGDISAGMDHRFKPGGGREAESVLEKFRLRRLAAKAQKDDPKDEENEQASAIS